MNAETLYGSRFTEILDPDEELLWTGKPNFWVFMFPYFVLLAAVLVLAVVSSVIFYSDIHHHHVPPLLFEYLKGKFFLSAVPASLGIGLTAWRWLSYPNVFYAYSNRRAIIRSGVWGIDFKTIGYDRIQNSSVQVSPLEKMLGVGTILLFTGEIETVYQGQIQSKKDKFVGIVDPYERFRRFKTVMTDVATDMNYPNALRPEINPGYKTKYRRTEPPGDRWSQ
jgi:membrane protein YdbS with pleckstrin-like domain